MGAGLDNPQYGHFVASLALCGMIAAAYPFFGVTCLAACSFYPVLVRLETMNRDDRQELYRLGRTAWLYLILAALVPTLAVLVLGFLGSRAYRQAGGEGLSGLES